MADGANAAHQGKARPFYFSNVGTLVIVTIVIGWKGCRETSTSQNRFRVTFCSTSRYPRLVKHRIYIAKITSSSETLSELTPNGMAAMEEPCVTPQRSLLNSIKKLFWSMQTAQMDGPGIALKSPEKTVLSFPIMSPQSPITSATPQRRSAAVESVRRKILLTSLPSPLKLESENNFASECHDSEEDVLFSPATWRHDDEEHGEGGKAQEAEGSHKNCNQKVSDDESEPDFCPYRFIKSLPSVETLAMSRPPVLPKKDKKYEEKMTLVLDLDETLVHCSVDPMENSELTFPVVHCGQEYQVHVRKRPFFKEFCEKVSEWFEVVIFTASQRVYADRLLDILDPNGMYFQHRLFRDHCHFHEGNYLKDLRVLNRDLKKVAIIDNSVQAFGLHLDNGIPVESWFDEDNDNELMRLIPFLDKLRDISDVRPYIRRQFRLKEVVSNL